MDLIRVLIFFSAVLVCAGAFMMVEGRNANWQAGLYVFLVGAAGVLIAMGLLRRLCANSDSPVVREANRITGTPASIGDAALRDGLVRQAMQDFIAKLKGIAPDAKLELNEGASGAAMLHVRIGQNLYVMEILTNGESGVE